MKDILFKIGTALHAVKWVRWALVLAYTLAVFWFAKSFGDALMFFVVYAFVVFVVNRIKAYAA